MNKDERIENSVQYLSDIGNAINALVERCGGSLETDVGILPGELTVNQRALFVHAGISGILSKAIISKNKDMINAFDCILGYHINKDSKDEYERHDFFATMIAAQFSQFMDECPDSEPKDHKFLVLINLFRFAFLIYNGYIELEEAKETLRLCAVLMKKYSDRVSEKLRGDAEKN